MMLYKTYGSQKLKIKQENYGDSIYIQTIQGSRTLKITFKEYSPLVTQVKDFKYRVNFYLVVLRFPEADLLKQQHLLSHSFLKDRNLMPLSKASNDAMITMLPWAVFLSEGLSWGRPAVEYLSELKTRLFPCELAGLKAQFLASLQAVRFSVEGIIQRCGHFRVQGCCELLVLALPPSLFMILWPGF